MSCSSLGILFSSCIFVKYITYLKSYVYWDILISNIFVVFLLIVHPDCDNRENVLNVFNNVSLCFLACGWWYRLVQIALVSTIISPRYSFFGLFSRNFNCSLSRLSALQWTHSEKLNTRILNYFNHSHNLWMNHYIFSSTTDLKCGESYP